MKLRKLRIIAILCLSFLMNPLCFAEKTAYEPLPKYSTPKNASTVTPSYDPMKHLSGTFALTTNYIYHGLSQTTNLPALQGGLTYSFDTGIYLNLWGASVRFVDVPPQTSKATVEFDTAIGYTNVFKGLTYNIYFDRYNYPRDSGLNYNEWIAIFLYSIFELELNYSSNAYNTHTSGSYAALTLHLPMPPKTIFNLNNVVLNGKFGHSSLSPEAGNDYNDYAIFITKQIDPYSLTLEWASTDGRYNYPQQFQRNLYFATFAAAF